MAEAWYVKDQNGLVTGPFNERQIAADLLNDTITATGVVRQGKSGPWCPASRARDVFRELAERGWYIRVGTDSFGPFTSDRLLDLHRAGELADTAEVRQGTQGPWKPANGVLSLWQTRQMDQAFDQQGMQPDRRTKWSTEPMRHFVLPIEKAGQGSETCRPWEYVTLQTNPDQTEARIAVLRSNNSNIGYLSSPNSQQLLSNAQRGITHVALFSNPYANPPEIAVILCPPGTESDECQQYIENHFASLIPSRPSQA